MLPHAPPGAAFRPGGVMRTTVGGRDLRKPELADVTRQRGLRDVVAFGLETLAQLLLTAHRFLPYNPQDGRVTLRLHGAEI